MGFETLASSLLNHRGTLASSLLNHREDN